MSSPINSNLISNSETTSNSDSFSKKEIDGLKSIKEQINKELSHIGEQIKGSVEKHNAMVEHVVVDINNLGDNFKSLESTMKHKAFLENMLKFLYSVSQPENNKSNYFTKIDLPNRIPISTPLMFVKRSDLSLLQKDTPVLAISSNLPKSSNPFEKNRSLSSSTASSSSSSSSSSADHSSKKAKIPRASSSNNGNSSSSTMSSSSLKKAKLTHAASSTDASLSEEEVILKTFRTGDEFFYKEEKLTFESYSKEEGLQLRDKNGQSVSVEDISKVIYCPTPGLRFLAKLDTEDKKYYVATVTEDSEQTKNILNKDPCVKIKNVNWECGGLQRAEKYGYDLKSFIPVHTPNFLNNLPNESVTLKRTENGEVTTRIAKVYWLTPRSKQSQ